MPPEQTASLITNGETVVTSNFIPAYYPKVIHRVFANRLKKINSYNLLINDWCISGKRIR